jgi:deoxyribose-phosphate aldolase
MLRHQEIASLIDHSMLSPNQTAATVVAGCRQALVWGVASVCVPPCYVAACTDLLQGSPVATCSVIGFPHGGETPSAKLYEARQALADGATELDMVINISAAVSEDFAYVTAEIRSILEAAHGEGAKLKVIFENCYLSDIHKIRLCEICVELGVDWAKTSTGFGPTGATIKDVTLMVHRCNPNVQVKASGGIRDLHTLQSFRQLGCTRIGCSRTAEVLAECDNP